MRLGLPHVNVLSKVDLLSHYGQLPFNLDFYTELEDLRPLAQFVGSTVPEQVIDVTKESEVVEREQRCERLKRMESKLTKKFKKMTTELCEVLSDFGLISFLPIDIRKCILIFIDLFERFLLIGFLYQRMAAALAVYSRLLIRLMDFRLLRRKRGLLLNSESNSKKKPNFVGGVLRREEGRQ